MLLESLAFVMDDRENVVGPDPDAPPSTAAFNGLDHATRELVGVYTGQSSSIRDRTQLREDLSVYLDDALGTHDLKLGLAYELEQGVESSKRGVVYDLYEGVPWRKTYQEPFNGIEPSTAAHSRLYTAYVQDAWSPRAGLTLNLGLRLDVQQIEFNGLEGFDAIRSQSIVQPR